MNDGIPTPEEATSAADVLSDYVRISFDQIPRQIRQPIADAMIDTVLPLLEAIAAGRVFEVRRELCANCNGVGGYIVFDEDIRDQDWVECHRCNGSGFEPGGAT